MTKIIVLEQTPLITSELQRFFLGEETVVEWYSVSNQSGFEFDDADLVVLNSKNDEPLLYSIQQLINAHSTTRLLLLVDQTDFAREALMRELGVDAILPVTTQKSRICEVVNRLCKR